jgi:hypothetical protein
MLTHADYKTAIICALPKELLAVRVLLDIEQAGLGKHEDDHKYLCSWTDGRP